MAGVLPPSLVDPLAAPGAGTPSLAPGALQWGRRGGRWVGTWKGRLPLNEGAGRAADEGAVAAGRVGLPPSLPGLPPLAAAHRGTPAESCSTAVNKPPLRGARPGAVREVAWAEDSYLVDPASSHMLVSKIKPCMCKYKLFCTVKLRMAH